MFAELTKFLSKPVVYMPSTDKFWDNEHISKGMLEAHLNPNTEGATRNHKFVMASVNWISAQFLPTKFPKLLDIGCDPGIYAEKFSEKGYAVTGVDFSKRSIEYAIANSKKKNLNIRYKYESYLEMSYIGEFDIITLIWCDFGVLSPNDRSILLDKVYTALKPNGVFVFDVFTEQMLKDKTERKHYEYNPAGGFWSASPYVCLNALYKYEGRIIVDQSVIIGQDKINCYNIWEHYFTEEEIKNDVQTAGFKNINLYADVAGQEYTPTSKTICVTAQKL